MGRKLIADGPLDPLEIPTPKRPLEFPHYFFLVTLGNSTSFLINPWKLHMLFLWYAWKFHILNPSCLDFFWNIPIQQLFLNFIFEEYKFSSFNTSDRSNNSLRCLKSEKNPLRTNSILIRKTELNKVLIMVCLLKPEGLSGAMTTEQHYFFDTFFSTYIKDWPAKIYLYGSLNTCKFLEP